jgi:hypothetical protein
VGIFRTSAKPFKETSVPKEDRFPMVIHTDGDLRLVRLDETTFAFERQATSIDCMKVVTTSWSRASSGTSSRASSS